MGWIIFDQRLHESDHLLISGRSLFLCQHFESTCKDIVMWLSLAKALDEKKFPFLSDQHKDYVEKLNRLFLGQSVQQLSAAFGTDFSIADIACLKAATASRNFICHECLLPLVHAPFGPHYQDSWEIEVHQAHIRSLAEGDYLVSRWSYEFHEKEWGGFKDRSTYVNGILSWIFGDLE